MYKKRQILSLPINSSPQKENSITVFIHFIWIVRTMKIINMSVLSRWPDGDWTLVLIGEDIH